MADLESKFLVQTIIRGLNVFECFKDDSVELGIKEISNIVNLSESTVYRIVVTLEYKGVLIQNPKSKKYRLGIGLLNTVDRVQNLTNWNKEAKYYMLELKNKFNETVNLAIRDEDKAVYIETIESSHVLRPIFRNWSKYPCHCSGLGKCLLLDFTENELKSLLQFPLKKYTDKTIVDIKSLMKNLEEARQQGYVLDDEEFQKGIICVSAPIRAFGNKILAAISLTMPTARFNNKTFDEIKKQVVNTAENISKTFETN